MIRTFQLKRRSELHSDDVSKHSARRCLHDALLHAEDDDAVIYAQAACVAANLINDTAEELDSVHIGSLVQA